VASTAANFGGGEKSVSTVRAGERAEKRNPMRVALELETSLFCTRDLRERSSPYNAALSEAAVVLRSVFDSLPTFCQRAPQPSS